MFDVGKSSLRNEDERKRSIYTVTERSPMFETSHIDDMTSQVKSLKSQSEKMEMVIRSLPASESEQNKFRAFVAGQIMCYEKD